MIIITYPGVQRGSLVTKGRNYIDITKTPDIDVVKDAFVMHVNGAFVFIPSDYITRWDVSRMINAQKIKSTDVIALLPSPDIKDAVVNKLESIYNDNPNDLNMATLNHVRDHFSEDIAEIKEFCDDNNIERCRVSNLDVDFDFVITTMMAYTKLSYRSKELILTIS